ncbi:MAG: hypothetical protein P8M04_06280 [Akkermansiaceae bacterium]|nr:hypothetical protein [Akkermansiaceae bacterium]
MLKNIRIISILCLALHPLLSLGQWSSQELSYGDEFQSPIQTGDRDTQSESYMIWSLINFERVKADALPYAQEIHLAGSENIQKDMPAMVALQRNDSGALVSAPMVVLINGFYSVHNSDLKYFDQLYQRGYHVLSLPTAWSLLYQNLKPNFPMGDFQKEAQVALDVLKNFINPLKSAGTVSSVGFMGHSYGTLVGIFMANLDNAHPALFDEDMVFVGPEANIEYALDHFDSYFKEFKIWNRCLLNKLKLLGSANRYEKAESWLDLKERDVNRAAPMLAYSAHRSLINILKVLKPDFKKYLRKNHRRPMEFGYRKYAKVYAPELLDIFGGDNGDFVKLYQKARRDNLRPLKILTSEDDFLNKAGAWDDIQEEVMILEGGSHFGFLVSDWFKGFIKMSFPPLN